jgi:hypothetical protein
VFSVLGEPGLLPLALILFVVGIVLLSLAAILDRLTHIEFLLKSSRATETDRVETNLGDFERVANVEGEAMCLGCRKTSPKAGMYYSRSLDVYYHPECLARDSRR